MPGRQSAALLLVPASGERWRTRFDIRVEDHADPLGELRRLLRLARAYEMASQADERVAEGANAEATSLYLKAAELAPEADELTFWAGVGVAAEDLDAGVRLVRVAASRKPAWLTLLDRLPVELAPTGEASGPLCGSAQRTLLRRDWTEHRALRSSPNAT